MMMGTALSREIDRDATSATAMEVVVELLCSIAVVRIPIRNPVKGFDVATMIDLVASGLKCPSADAIRSMAKRNNTSTPAT
jgi:hypothetical protein